MGRPTPFLVQLREPMTEQECWLHSRGPRHNPERPFASKTAWRFYGVAVTNGVRTCRVDGGSLSYPPGKKIELWEKVEGF